MKKSVIQRVGAFIMGATMMLGAVLPASALDRVSEGLPIPGQDYYVSVHQYISPTDMDDVYRVTVTVKGTPPPQKQTRVVAVIDTSSSMNQNDQLETFDSQSQFFNRWELADSYTLWMMAAGLFGGTNGTFTLTKNVITPATQFPSALSDDKVLFPRGSVFDQVIYTSSSFTTTTTAVRSSDLDSANYSKPANYKTHGMSLGTGGLNWESNYDYSSTSGSKTTFTINGATTNNPGFYGANVSDVDGDYPFPASVLPTHWVKPNDREVPKLTRLGAAIAGAKNATDTFLTLSSNPAALITSFGVVGFSDNADTLEDPYTTIAPLGDSYGYGMDPNGAFAWAPWGKSITFSSRYNVIPPGGPGTTMIDNMSTTWGPTVSPTPPYVGPLLGGDYENVTYTLEQSKLYKYMKTMAAVPYPTDLDQAMQDAYPDMVPNLSTASTVHNLMKNGLVPYDGEGIGKQAFKDIMDDMFFASTGGSGTDIIDSMDEAAILLFGPEGAQSATSLGTTGVADTATGVNDVDDIRRYVIFLSDGGDNSPGGPESTFEKINNLKAKGVEFMVIGIDAEDGDKAHEQQTTDANGFVVPAKTLPPTATSIDSQYLAWMGSRLVDYTTSFSSWAAVDTNYTGTTTGGAYNYVPYSTNYTYIDAANGDMTEQIEAAFADFVNKIVNIGEDAKVSADLNIEYFSIYQMPGKPRFEFFGAAGQKVIETNGKFVWDHNGGLPLYGSNTVSFYVKVNKDKMNDPNFSSVLLNAEYSCVGQFPLNGVKPLEPYGVWPEIVMVKDVPVAMISPANGIKQTSTAEDVESSSPAMTYASDENKSSGMAIPINTNVSLANSKAVPEITDVSSNKLKSGKTRVSVTVKNGKDMRYQWQKQNADKKWEDIFGANTSVYTLGKGFVAGKKYTLRCVVTNPAGDPFYSNPIVVTATKSNVSSEKLQTSKK